MTTERRLDDVVAALGRARPRLDEITRARVAGRVEAELARTGPAAPIAPRRRWPWVALAAGALAAAAAAVIAMSARGGGGRPGAAPGAPAAGAEPTANGSGAPARDDDDAIPGEAPRPARVPLRLELAAGDSARVNVAAGDSRLVAVGDMVLTVFGPGHLEVEADRATADAAALVIDRSQGDAPWSLRYDHVDIVATRATFALDRTKGVRVTVMRGELVLRCGGAPRALRAGESAGCEPETLPPARTDTGRVAAARTTIHRAPGTDATAVAAPEPPPATEPPPPATEPPAADSLAGMAPPPTEPPPEPVASSAAPDLYALAEGAMRRGDRAGARVALQAVIDAHPASLDAALALLDLALLAHRDHDDGAARAYLGRLDAHPHRKAVATPAARLRAQLAPR